MVTEGDTPAPDFPSEDSPYAPGIGVVGHAGSYWPYDMEDGSGPDLRRKRAPGFVTEDDYVTRKGVVKQYKRPRRHK